MIRRRSGSWYVDEESWNEVSLTDATLQDVLKYYKADWYDITVTSDGQPRHFACKQVDANYVLKSFSLDPR